VAKISGTRDRYEFDQGNRNKESTTRRANLLVDEVEFNASYVGKTARIGDQIEFD